MGGFSSIVGLSQAIANTLYDAINAATNAINGHKDITTGVHGAGASTVATAASVALYVDELPVRQSLEQSGNTHDAGVSTNSTAYVLKKTMTMESRLVGTIGIYMEIATQYADSTARGVVLKNGVQIGNVHTTTTIQYTANTQYHVVDLVPGDTLELWINTADAGSICYARNFRINYNIFVPKTITNS